VFGLRKSLKEGDRWSFAARPHEPDASVTVHRLEGETVHVALSGLRLWSATGDEGTTIGHLPIARSALRASVSERLERGVAPSSTFEDGYAQWSEARGGTFSLPLVDVIGIVESSLAPPSALLDRWVGLLRTEPQEALVTFAYRAVLALPTLHFLSDPDRPNAPLFWRFDGRDPCVPVFSDPARASVFVESAALGTPELVSLPTEKAVAWMLDGLAAEGIAYASVNTGTALDLPLYFDVLRQVMAL